MNLKLHVWRQNGPNDKGAFVTYDATDVNEEMSFLEMLDVINEGLEGEGKEPIAFESDCREGICGSCGFLINGQPHGPKDSTTVLALYSSAGETIGNCHSATDIRRQRTCYTTFSFILPRNSAGGETFGNRQIATDTSSIFPNDSSAPLIRYIPVTRALRNCACATSTKILLPNPSPIRLQGPSASSIDLDFLNGTVIVSNCTAPILH